MINKNIKSVYIYRPSKSVPHNCIVDYLIYCFEKHNYEIIRTECDYKKHELYIFPIHIASTKFFARWRRVHKEAIKVIDPKKVILLNQ